MIETLNVALKGFKDDLSLDFKPLEHSNVCAGIPELPGITRNYPELGIPREASIYGLTPHN